MFFLLPLLIYASCSEPAKPLEAYLDVGNWPVHIKEDSVHCLPSLQTLQSAEVHVEIAHNLT